MTEQVYLARFIGGPLDGETRMSSGPWPLADEWTVAWSEAGVYRKVRESQLTEDHPNVARGAEYEWQST